MNLHIVAIIVGIIITLVIIVLRRYQESLPDFSGVGKLLDRLKKMIPRSEPKYPLGTVLGLVVANVLLLLLWPEFFLKQFWGSQRLFWAVNGGIIGIALIKNIGEDSGKKWGTVLALLLAIGVLYNLKPEGKVSAGDNSTVKRVAPAEERWTLTWALPPDVKNNDPRRSLLVGSYKAQIVRNDSVVFEIVMFFEDGWGRKNQSHFFWNKTRSDYGEWSQTEPADGGKWYLKPSPTTPGKFIGALTSEKCTRSDQWIPMELVRK